MLVKTVEERERKKGAKGMKQFSYLFRSQGNDPRGGKSMRCGVGCGQAAPFRLSLR